MYVKKGRKKKNVLGKKEKNPPKTNELELQEHQIIDASLVTEHMPQSKWDDNVDYYIKVHVKVWVRDRLDDMWTVGSHRRCVGCGRNGQAWKTEWLWRGSISDDHRTGWSTSKTARPMGLSWSAAVRAYTQRPEEGQTSGKQCGEWMDGLIDEVKSCQNDCTVFSRFAQFNTQSRVKIITILCCVSKH